MDRLRLGWMDPEKVKVVNPREKSRVILSPLEDIKGKTLVVKIPITESTYYLIEKPPAARYDNNLPGSGVLVMFADDRVRECRKGKSPVKLINADLQWSISGEQPLTQGRNRNLQTKSTVSGYA